MICTKEFQWSLVIKSKLLSMEDLYIIRSVCRHINKFKLMYIAGYIFINDLHKTHIFVGKSLAFTMMNIITNAIYSCNFAMIDYYKDVDVKPCTEKLIFKSRLFSTQSYTWEQYMHLKKILDSTWKNWYMQLPHQYHHLNIFTSSLKILRLSVIKNEDTAFNILLYSHKDIITIDIINHINRIIPIYYNIFHAQSVISNTIFDHKDLWINNVSEKIINAFKFHNQMYASYYDMGLKYVRYTKYTKRNKRKNLDS
jgi:hypothetical protein